MNFRTLLTALTALIIVFPAWGEDSGWKSLWNGRDLEGWDTYLHRPHKSVILEGEERNEKGEHINPVGVNVDPKQVFTIVEQDGGPAIRVSGEIYGTITTREEFSNYHLTLEIKWGEKKWEPRLERVRDSGLLYHAAGEWGDVGAWLPSLELQIQETDMGDFWCVNSQVTIRSRPFDETLFIYDPKGEPKVFAMPVKDVPRRCLKGFDAENPVGEWNVVELVCLGDKAWHIVNGQVVLIAEEGKRWDGEKFVPATEGRIQLQSEGAELFYRNIRIRPVEQLPEQFAKQQ